MWQALCKDSVKDLYNGLIALCKDSGKKNSTMDWMVRWQALCKYHVKDLYHGWLFPCKDSAKDLYNIEAFECIYLLPNKCVWQRK